MQGDASREDNREMPLDWEDVLPTEQQIHEHVISILECWGDDPPPRFDVKWNFRLRTAAGRAILEPVLRVELNPHLLARHPDQFLPTLIHEMAHVLVYHRYGKGPKAHGVEWQRLMRQAGQNPEARHGMNVDGLRRKRRKFLYLHVCQGCGTWGIYRKLRRDLQCGRCGPGEFQVFRSIATREGLAQLQRKAEKRRTGS